MYKMLLVEDEPATMEGIKSAINWSLLDVIICGEATNGLEAIQLIDNLKPDIILCDIRMPKMDGISLINEIQPRHPNLKVIFLSGYSDKEYLKNAIKLNVVDYIYKPVELAELVQAIEKAKASCAKKYSEENVSQDNNIALNLIQGWTPTNTLKNISIDLDDYLITIIVQFNTDLEVTLETEAITINQYLPAFKQSLSSFFDDRYVISSLNNGYVLHANVSKNFTQNIETFNQLAQLLTIVKNSSKCLTIGISNPVQSSMHLKDSFQQARDAVRSSFLIGYGKLIFYKDLNTAHFSPSENLDSQFFNQINVNNVASAIDFLEEYLTYMCRCSPEDIPAIKDELVNISFGLNRKLQKNENIQQGYVMQTINYALDMTDIRQYLFQLLDQIVNDINSLDNKGRIIFDVEKYILQNYDKDLSTKKIAESVYITPTYLCHLYKVKTGRTLNQFILDVKMNKSKKLITDTSLRLCDIAERMGYNNQNYFTKTFTKYFGVNPSTFRNKRLL